MCLTSIFLMYIAFLECPNPSEPLTVFCCVYSWVLARQFLNLFTSSSITWAEIVFHPLWMSCARFAPLSSPPSFPSPPCPLYLRVLPELHQACIVLYLNTTFLPLSLFSYLTYIYPFFYFSFSTHRPGLEPMSSYSSHTTEPPSQPVVSQKVPEELMVFFSLLSKKTSIHGWCHWLNYVRDSGWGQNKTEIDDHPMFTHTYLQNS